jgi:hypothetical protein
VSKLRINRVVESASLCLLAVACSADSRPPKHELYEPVSAGGQQFLIPYEHAMGGTSRYASAGSGFEESGDNSFLARFSAAWLAGHVDGFQPILNVAFQSITAYVFVTPQGESPPLLAPGIVRDIWYGGYGWEQREITGEREPNTGLYIIKQIPSPLDRDFWSGVLAESLPIEGQPYPEDPPWAPFVCSHRPVLILPASQSYTRCKVWARADGRIAHSVSIAGENLRIRDAVMQAIGEEILRWRELAERQAREAPSDAPR